MGMRPGIAQIPLVKVSEAQALTSHLAFRAHPYTKGTVEVWIARGEGLGLKRRVPFEVFDGVIVLHAEPSRELVVAGSGKHGTLLERITKVEVAFWKINVL